MCDPTGYNIMAQLTISKESELMLAGNCHVLAGKFRLSACVGSHVHVMYMYTYDKNYVLAR